MAAVTLAWVIVAQVALPPEPAWKDFASYGALGLITVYLIWERYVTQKAERRVRHAQADALGDNTKATDKLSGQIKQLTDVLWLSLGGSHIHRRSEDTPPKNPKTEDRGTDKLS